MRRIVPAALLLASPGLAQAAPQIVVGAVGPGDAGHARTIELIALNGESAPATVEWPAAIAATIAGAPATLTRESGAARIAVPAGGFVKARYRFVAPAGAVISIPALQVAGVALPGPTQVAAAVPAPAPQPPAESPAPTRSGFLANFAPYQPVYAVYGPGTNSDAKLQLSFQYQPFGQAGDMAPLLNRLRFAYTQRMFWDLGRNSSPFRDVNYMPELFYLQPAIALGHGIALSGQAGLRHESNGRSGTASRSVNMIYVQPQVVLPVGGYRLELGPRLWAYLGARDGNPDIAHYRGNAGLHVGFGQRDGLWLAADSRLNPSSGKGAVEGELSYPLPRLVGPGINLYVFAQGFTGYGEDLLDYDRRQTRARIGIGVVR